MSQVRNPNIVHFYGASIEPKLVICLEYCAKGSLFHYLQDTQNSITWPLIFKWIKEMTNGLNALHSFVPTIVHRDFKSLNLLVRFLQVLSPTLLTSSTAGFKLVD